jgi:hypothetical protein
LVEPDRHHLAVAVANGPREDRAEACRIADWRKQAWLLKNSLIGKWSKKLYGRKPYKRRSLLVDIFYLPNSGCFGKTGAF